MRRLVTAVVVAAMVVLSGCGRQVTGLDLPNGGLALPGQTVIRFETAGPLDLQNLSYLIVINTTGNTQQPYAQGFNSDFRNWSAFFVVGGGANFVNNPGLEQVYQDPTSGTSRTFNVTYPSGTVNLQTSIPNANAQYGFQITFNRCIIDLVPATSTQSPGTFNTASICPPYNNIATTWNVSIFTLDKTQSPVDSLGTTGPSDTSYRFLFDTSQLVNTNFFKPASNTTVQNPSAQIVGIEVFSTPPNGAVSSPSPTPSSSPGPSPSPTGAPSRAPVSLPH